MKFIEKGNGSVRFATIVLTQPLASWTETLYVPADKPVKDILELKVTPSTE